MHAAIDLVYSFSLSRHTVSHVSRLSLIQSGAALASRTCGADDSRPPELTTTVTLLHSNFFFGRLARGRPTLHFLLNRTDHGYKSSTPIDDLTVVSAQTHTIFLRPARWPVGVGCIAPGALRRASHCRTGPGEHVSVKCFGSSQMKRRILYTGPQIRRECAVPA